MKRVIFLIISVAVATGCAHSDPEHTYDSPKHAVVINESLTPKLLTAIAAGDAEATGQLLQNHANPNAKNAGGETVLIQMIRLNNITIAKMLLLHGADANIADKDGMTPLMYVIANSNKPVPKTLNDGQIVYINPPGTVNNFLLDLLVANGADVNAKNQKSVSALICAAEQGNQDAVEFLIKKKANVNATDNKGRTSLICAASKGHSEIVRKLLDNSADINATDAEGQTALIHSVQGEYLQISQILIQKGALVNIRDHSGATALKLAKLRGNKDITAVLEKNNATET